MLTDICPVCGNRKKRSPPQNSRYWKLVRAMSAASQEFSAEAFHEYFKRQFLPMLEIDLPDWSTMLIPRSTANLPMHPDPKDPDAPNWETYTLQVERWCAERGVYLQEGE